MNHPLFPHDSPLRMAGECLLFAALVFAATVAGLWLAS